MANLAEDHKVSVEEKSTLKTLTLLILLPVTLTIALVLVSLRVCG